MRASPRVQTDHITSIYVPEGRRPVQEAAIVRLMDSIEKLGLQVPLAVRTVDEFDIPGEGLVSNVRLLVAGAHRLEACRRLGMETVPFVEFSDATEARMWEISENLHRADLTVQERADQLAEWITLSEAKAFSTQDVSKLGRPEGGIRAASRELGVNREEARRAVKIAGITPEAREAADAAGLTTQKARLEIAAAPVEQQVQRVAEVAARKPVPLPKNEIETEDDWRNAMMRLWNRAPDEWRERFVDYVQQPVFDRTGSGRG